MLRALYHHMERAQIENSGSTEQREQLTDVMTTEVAGIFRAAN